MKYKIINLTRNTITVEGVKIGPYNTKSFDVINDTERLKLLQSQNTIQCLMEDDVTFIPKPAPEVVPTRGTTRRVKSIKNN